MAQSLHSALIDRLDARHAEPRHAAQAARPFVTLSYAQSLDGCISAQTGTTLQLSNLHSQTLTHALRARHDAILIGVNTVLADDPRLTVRLVDGTDPTPVIVDSQLRMPPAARILRERRRSGVIVATTVGACAKREAKLVAAGAKVVRLPVGANGRVDLTALLAYLHQAGLKTLMVEGGARIITSFLAERLADHLIITVCPVLVSGLRAVDGTCAMPLLSNVQHFPLEGDLIVSADLSMPEIPKTPAKRVEPAAEPTPFVHHRSISAARLGSS